MIAVTHIQKTAPAPPAEIAATTPTRLPMPTRVAVETMSACMPESRPLAGSAASLPSCFSSSTEIISGNRRSGKMRVRIV